MSREDGRDLGHVAHYARVWGGVQASGFGRVIRLSIRSCFSMQKEDVQARTCVRSDARSG